MDNPLIRRYRHGNVPNAMRAAVREMLEEGDPEAVGLRDAARRIGVSSTAAYRHFANKEHLLASVAAEGFSELAAAIQRETLGQDPLYDVALAYLDFATRNQGLFRLMFGPLLLERTQYPVLDAAAANAIDCVRQAAREAGEDSAMIVWPFIHGLSSLALGGVIDQERTRDLVQQALAKLRMQGPAAGARAGDPLRSAY